MTDPTTTGRCEQDIPVAHTPPGGYGLDFPDPFLAGCNTPIVEGAPDLRGIWQVTEVSRKGKPVPRSNRVYRHFERIEQCGDRIIITGGGVVHDMRCDGSIEHGVHDVAQRDFRTKIIVVATYENGIHVLRPVLPRIVKFLAGLRGYNIEVTRSRDGEDMIWQYVNFTARLKRIGSPEDRPPSV